MKAEKKVRTSRVKDTVVSEKNRIADIGDAAFGGVLPEQTDAGAEILQATERHEAAERETAEVLALVDKKTVRTNGQIGEVKTTEPAKAQYLTDDAHKQRKLDVANVGLRRYAAEHSVRAYFDKLVLAGRSVDQPLTLGEYRAYLFGAQQSGAPASDRPRMFTEDAFAVVKHLYKGVKEALFKRFDGQTVIGLTDEFLLAVAEATVANDTKFSLAIDGEPMNCGNQTCNRRFVPVKGITTITREGKSQIREFGNFRRVGTQVVGFCSV